MRRLSTSGRSSASALAVPVRDARVDDDHVAAVQQRDVHHDGGAGGGRRQQRRGAEAVQAVPTERAVHRRVGGLLQRDDLAARGLKGNGAAAVKPLPNAATWERATRGRVNGWPPVKCTASAAPKQSSSG